MFKKLCKHEFKALSNLLVPLLIALGIAGGFVCISLVINGGIGIFQGFSGVGVSLLYGLLTAAAFSGVGVVTAVAQILIYVRFYKSTMTEEGYLTFTLPVKTYEIFFSKVLMAIVWEIIIFAADIIILGLANFTFHMTLPSDIIPIIDQELAILYSFISSILFDLVHGEPESLVYLIANIVRMIVALPFTVIGVFTLITVASTLTQKRRVLMMIALYFGWSLIVNIVDSILGNNFISIILNGMPSAESMIVAISSCVRTVFQIAVGVGFVFLDRFLLEKRLNI